MSFRKKLLLLFLCLLIPYAIVEVTSSTLYRFGVIDPPPTAWFFEKSGETVHFDPLRGVRLTSQPSRFSRVTRGITEYLGTLRGNSQGFPDRDDFSPERDSPGSIRIAVLGESFTAAQYIGVNWPDRVEDLSRNTGCPLELLNFSVDGAGLANWWSILIRIIGAENYQVDGIVFAVYRENLQRTFTMADHRHARHHIFGRTTSWKPEEWPATISEARPYLEAVDSTYILSEESFRDAIEGRWHPELPRPWHLYFLNKVVWFARKAFSRRSAGSASPEEEAEEIKKGGFQPGQVRLIDDISEFARARGLPILVIRIPSREELLEGILPSGDLLRFAELLDAAFADGGEAFREKTAEGVRNSFFPYDGHWNQTGSDRFATWVTENIQEWMCDPAGDSPERVQPKFPPYD